MFCFLLFRSIYTWNKVERLVATNFFLVYSTYKDRPGEKRLIASQYLHIRLGHVYSFLTIINIINIISDIRTFLLCFHYCYMNDKYVSICKKQTSFDFIQIELYFPIVKEPPELEKSLLYWVSINVSVLYTQMINYSSERKVV